MANFQKWYETQLEKGVKNVNTPLRDITQVQFKEFLIKYPRLYPIQSGDISYSTFYAINRQMNSYIAKLDITKLLPLVKVFNQTEEVLKQLAEQEENYKMLMLSAMKTMLSDNKSSQTSSK